MSNCCYRCAERQVGCHSACERYEAFVKENEIIKKNRAESSMQVSGIGTGKMPKMLRLGRQKK